MKAAIITVAGMSSRFNEGVPESKRELKAIYTENCSKDTLLYHLLQKCNFSDKIIVVGGYKFEDLRKYCDGLAPELQDKLSLVYNGHYEDLSSGYSLYLGLKEAFKQAADEILFVEGDLDIDSDSFASVVESRQSVLTYTFEPIYADKAVVLYRDDKNRYRYAFNSNHGLLSIDVPFSCILNSGQTWKFTQMELLQQANEKFYNEAKGKTNLQIIQNYLDMGVAVDLVAIKRWVNCNTKEDFRRIVSYWEEDK